MGIERKVTSKEFLSNMHIQMNKSVSFKTFIQQLRKSVFKVHLYIINNVSYDEMIMDLVQLGELPYETLQKIKWEEDDK